MTQDGRSSVISLQTGRSMFHSASSRHNIFHFQRPKKSSIFPEENTLLIGKPFTRGSDSRSEPTPKTKHGRYNREFTIPKACNILNAPSYTRPKKVGTLEYLGKYKLYRKVFQTKIIGLINIYLLILLV